MFFFVGSILQHFSLLFMDIISTYTILSPLGEPILCQKISYSSGVTLIISFQWSKSAWYPWFIYFGLILTAFSLIKAVNLKLHLMFDTSEAIEEQDVDKHRQKKVNSSR